jgi:hypothetical protein
VAFEGPATASGGRTPGEHHDLHPGVVAVICSLIAIRLAQDDDTLRRALAVPLGLLALGSAGLGAVYALAWWKHGASGEKS